MARVRFRGRDWVKSIFLDSNADPGSTKDVDLGTCLGKITATKLYIVGKIWYLFEAVGSDASVAVSH